MASTFKIKSLSAVLVAIGLSAACEVTLAATVYKWVGPDGSIQYSDRPPPGQQEGVERKRIDTGVNAIAPAKASPAVTGGSNDGGGGQNRVGEVGFGQAGTANTDDGGGPVVSGGPPSSSVGGGTASGGTGPTSAPVTAGTEAADNAASGTSSDGTSAAESSAISIGGVSESESIGSTTGTSSSTTPVPVAATATAGSGTSRSSTAKEPASSALAPSTPEASVVVIKPAASPAADSASATPSATTPSSTASESTSSGSSSPEGAAAAAASSTTSSGSTSVVTDATEEAAVDPYKSPPAPAPVYGPIRSAVDREIDFRRRCAASGVVFCEGFDSKEVVDKYSNLYPDGTPRAKFDSSMKASGAGSLRIDHLPHEQAAWWQYRYERDTGERFRAGDTMYVQFRQRFDDNMMSVRFNNSWKQVIFHMNGAACAGLELTTVNTYLSNIPTMYSACGGRSTIVYFAKYVYAWQQGDYVCSTADTSRCGYYRPNQWMTFYYEVKIGDWGKPNSHVLAYMGYEGEPLKSFVNIKDYQLDNNDGADDGFNAVTLTTYITGKDMKQDHPVASSWYDELIVSRKPIPSPGYKE